MSQSSLLATSLYFIGVNYNMPKLYYASPVGRSHCLQDAESRKEIAGVEGIAL